MNDSTYWQSKISGSGLSRRAFLRSTALTGAGAAAFLAGCRSTAPATPAASSGPAAASTAGALFSVPEGKRGGTLTLSGSDPTTGWDPYATIATTTGNVTDPMGIKLIRHDYRKTPGWKSGSEQMLLGELAEKWESPDQLTFNFTLRKGINWPDQEPMKGRPITAQDVKYSFDHALLPTSAVQSYVFGSIASVRAVDDYTIQFKLTQPNWDFANTLDAYNDIVLPQGLYEWAGADGIKDSNKARGGGPWMLEEYQPGSVIKWKPNEAYRKYFGVPYLDHVYHSTSVIGAATTRNLQAFISKQIDVFSPLAGQFATAQQGRPDAKSLTTDYAQACGLALYMNTQVAPFDDIRVRRAISMGIDRDGWGKTLQNGDNYRWENGPVSWGYPDWKVDPKKMSTEQAANLQYNPAEATKLISAAGITGKTYVMHEYPYDSSYEAQCQFLIDALSKIGIKHTLKVYEYNNWIATAYQGKYEGTLFTQNNLDRVSAQLEDRLLKGSLRNTSSINDDATQKLLKDFWAAKGPAEAKPISDALQLRSVDQVFAVHRPIIPQPVLWNPALQNFEGQTSINYTSNWRTAFYWMA